MPIGRLPVLVRRSTRATTVAATRRRRAGFTALAEIAPGLQPQTLEQRRVVVKRMPGEEESNSMVFSFCRRSAGSQACDVPISSISSGDGRTAEEFVLTEARGLVGSAVPPARTITSTSRKGARAIALQANRTRRRPPGSRARAC